MEPTILVNRLTCILFILIVTKKNIRSLGQAALHQEVRINSSDPVNVPGEILTKGPNVLLGYYKNEEDTGQTIDNHGWLHNGDLGLMYDDGNVFIK